MRISADGRSLPARRELKNWLEPYGKASPSQRDRFHRRIPRKGSPRCQEDSTYYRISPVHSSQSNYYSGQDLRATKYNSPLLQRSFEQESRFSGRSTIVTWEQVNSSSET